MKLSTFQTTSIILGLITVFFLFLGNRGLNEPDEGRYAEIARETLVDGNWLTPRLNGFAHFQKPPMLYWVTALSFKVFGMNEWAARLPSTCAALGILALTAWMASIMFGRHLALPTVLILSSTILFFSLAHFLTPDMLMSFFIVAALSCLVRATFGTTANSKWIWGFFVAMGLGFLTKGPMALVVPLSAALALQLAHRRKGQSLSIPWLRGALITLSISLSWFLLMVWTYPHLWDYFVGYELIKRFCSSTHGRSQPFWYFIPVFIIGFIPWIFFAPVMARRLWLRLKTKIPLSYGLWLLIGWTMPPFIILSLSGSKLLTYLLPLFPAFALAMAYGWFQQKYSLRTLSMVCTSSIALLLLVFSQAELWNNQFGRQASIRTLAQHIQRLPQYPTPTVFASGVRTHGLEFYLGELVTVTRSEADLVLGVIPDQQKRLFESHAEFEKDMVGKPNTYGIARYDDFLEYFQNSGWDVLERAGDFVLITPNSRHEGRQSSALLPSYK